MASKLTKFSSISGVLAPGYRNRTDLNKYDLALALGTNWFVDYQGGFSSRPGTQFYDYIEHDDKNVKLIPFQYSVDLPNTYMILFGHNYIRFLQDGAYVLEALTTITATAGAVHTLAAHGLSAADWCKLSDGTTVIISVPTANTFELVTPFGDQVLRDLTGISIARIYTKTSTFTSAMIPNLQAHQIKDTLRITSIEREFKPYSLTRVDSTNWTLARARFKNQVDVPTGVTGSGAAGASTVIYVVTAVDEDGEESLPSDRCFVINIADFTVTAGYAKLEWDPQDNIRYYNVYRSVVGKDGKVTAAAQLGYAGRAYGPAFIDNNIIPDWTRSPPLSINPFADSRIKFINVTAPGAGYTNASIVTVTDADGTGFEGFPVISESGEVIAVVVTNGGQNYTAPVVSVDVGAGATFSVELGEADGNFPAVGCVFQQRQIYASTYNRPLGVSGSKPGLYSNFDYGDIVNDGDSFSFDLDSEVVAPINHLTPTRAGLLLTTSVGMWQLSGSSGGPVTATDAQSDRQSYTGVSAMQPLRINEDLAVLDAEYTSVRLLSYSDFQKAYVSTDISVLSNHFFKKTNPINSWDYFSAPHRLVISTRNDGLAVVACILREHEIFGWTDWVTRGYFLQVANLREETVDQPYFVVKRRVRGAWKKYIEGLAPRSISNVEDYVGLDCSLSLAATYPAAGVTLSAITGDVTVTSDAAVFAALDVGKVWRGGGGMGLVTTYTSATEIIVEMLVDVTSVLPTTDIPSELVEGDWSLDSKVTEVSGLDHLEGETVWALIDGGVVEDLVVTDGAVTLPQAASRAIVGYRYECKLKALPVNVNNQPIETDRKRIVALAVWENETRGLKAGITLDNLYEFRERTNEDYGLPPELREGLSFISLDPEWTTQDSFYLVQDQPLPASILGWVTSVEWGDDDDKN